MARNSDAKPIKSQQRPASADIPVYGAQPVPGSVVVRGDDLTVKLLPVRVGYVTPHVGEGFTATLADGTVLGVYPTGPVAAAAVFEWHRARR